MGLHRYLQVKGGGIQNPVTRRWAACTGPRREGRNTGNRIVPNRGPDLPESSGYTQKSLPAGSLTPDVEGIELYSLPSSHGEMDSLLQRPLFHSKCGYPPKPESKWQVTQKMTYLK